MKTNKENTEITEIKNALQGIDTTLRRIEKIILKKEMNTCVTNNYNVTSED